MPWKTSAPSTTLVYKQGMLPRAMFVIAFVVLLAALCIPGFSQQKPEVAGDYLGKLGPIHLKLHIKAAPDGSLTGTMDSPDQGVNGLPCSDFRYDGQSLSFSVPAVHGTWKGSIGDGGRTLSGVWDQGNPMPLNFSRDTFTAAAKPSAVDGIWLGKITEGSELLRVQIQVKSDNTGKEYCTFDSLDQEVTGIDCSNVVFEGNKFSFEIPAGHAKWSGTLSADGKTLTGTWTQSATEPLTFERQATAVTLPPVPPPRYDPAMQPVPLTQLQPVLEKDLAEALQKGAMAPTTHVGVAIGVVDHGQRKIFTYGVAKADSIFEIGSITKTFTGLMLAQMVEQGKVRYDEPVRQLLPEGTVAQPAGDEITLLDLATQHSGLPRMPDNFRPADKNNPYLDYTAADMYAYLKKQGVAKPAKTNFLYSNYGFGLLGEALADRAGLSYPQLLRDEITAPLAMKDTVVELSPEQQARFLQGYDGRHRLAHAWDLAAFAGAGAIRSTATDMLTYLDANLHPGQLPASAGTTPAGKTLPAALTRSHELRADAMEKMRIALAWLYVPEDGAYWHNGATGGFSSYAEFNPKADYGVVVLVNTSIGRSFDLADSLGHHVSQRLSGKPALVIP